MGRSAVLVLVSAAGELLGMLPPIELPVPYWPECADVVAEALARFGVSVVVLRMLEVEPAGYQGGKVAYLAELRSELPSVPLQAIPTVWRERALSSDPKRSAWAERGGPARSLAWARAALGRDFEPIQQRSWNLSTLWRLQSDSGLVWLKQVPHFMRHESAVLGWVNDAVPGAVPTLLAADGSGRSLLAHVEGEDLYGAAAPIRQRINERLHELQCAAAGDVEQLLALGVPDQRGARLGATIRARLLSWCPDYPGLEALLCHLDEQLERLDACRLPATLVHADNHPGNARGSARQITLLDWGEAFIGSPVTDFLGAIAGLSAQDAAPLKASWCASWQRLAPDSRPEAALELAPFLAALHGAAIYAHFLAQIEESEWPYHQQDVPRCLELARALLDAG